jgi:acyl-CoA synthetase (NDP forming)
VLDDLLPTAFFDMAPIVTLMQVPGLTKNLAEYIINSRGYGKPIAVVNFGGSELVQRFEEELEDQAYPSIQRQTERRRRCGRCINTGR